jgi:hypothetical protein
MESNSLQSICIVEINVNIFSRVCWKSMVAETFKEKV